MIFSRYGAVISQHQMKVLPWVARLDAATDYLEAAVQRRDIDEVLFGLEDVWFWIGRLQCDLMSSLRDLDTEDAIKAAQSMFRGHRATLSARELIAGSGST